MHDEGNISFGTVVLFSPTACIPVTGLSNPQSQAIGLVGLPTTTAGRKVNTVFCKGIDTLLPNGNPITN
jgi:hypothetical protein